MTDTGTVRRMRANTPRAAALNVWQAQSADTTAMLQSVRAALIWVAANMPHERHCHLNQGCATACDAVCDCNADAVLGYALNVAD